MVGTDGGPERVRMSADVLQGIDPVMQSHVDDRGFAGLSVAVARHGRVVFTGRYGQRDKEAGLPMSRDAIFRIYSMTKPSWPPV